MDFYKKIAKNMLIKEHAWDRKFGDPLPTLEDVMNEAESMQLQPKGGGKTVVFKNKDNYEKAKKSGEYEEPEETDDDGGEKEDPSGKLGKGDFERDFEDDPDDIDDLPDDGEPEGGEEPSGEPEAGEEEPSGEPEAGEEEPEGADNPLSPDYDSKKASEDFEKDKEWMLGRQRDDGRRSVSSYETSMGSGSNWEIKRAKKRKEEWNKKKEQRGQRATAIASGEVAPNSPEDANMALDHSQQEIYRAKKMIKGKFPSVRAQGKEALKKAKGQHKAAKTAVKQQAKKQGWKTSFGSGRVKTESANSITINGKTYKKIQEQKKVTDKHILREMYERIGGK
jgi:hypothetical protein